MISVITCSIGYAAPNNQQKVQAADGYRALLLIVRNIVGRYQPICEASIAINMFQY